jgi:uncharacterized membrane protein YccC
MPTIAANRTDVERVLVEVTSLLLERARVQLEREVDAGQQTVSDELRRMRDLLETLQAIRQERAVAAAVPAPVPLQREVSRFYEVPGQEDA